VLFKLFQHFYDFVIVCISWNNKSVLALLMHGANMKYTSMFKLVGIHNKLLSTVRCDLSYSFFHDNFFWMVNYLFSHIPSNQMLTHSYFN